MTPITTLGGIVYTLMFTLMFLGHFRELKTGEVEGRITKVASFIMVGQILIPITGMALVANALNVVLPTSMVMEAHGLIAILSFAASFGLAVVSMIVAGDSAQFVYTKVFGWEPHSTWQ